MRVYLGWCVCVWFAEFTDSAESNGSQAKWFVGSVVASTENGASRRGTAARALTPCPTTHRGSSA
ncbi:hypothetical protein JOB18_005411, partial [Solea senegalensis]